MVSFQSYRLPYEARALPSEPQAPSPHKLLLQEPSLTAEILILTTDTVPIEVLIPILISMDIILIPVVTTITTIQPAAVGPDQLQGRPVVVVVEVEAVAIEVLEVVINERQAPLAGQVRDGEHLADLKERRPFTQGEAEGVVADGEGLAEERLPADLIPGRANPRILAGKKVPVEVMDRVR